MMNAAERRGDPGARKRPKRIITDARKEQNRVAQKLFRESGTMMALMSSVVTNFNRTKTERAGSESGTPSHKLAWKATPTQASPN